MAWAQWRQKGSNLLTICYSMRYLFLYVAALSALVAAGKDFSREELVSMLVRLEASPEPYNSLPISVISSHLPDVRRESFKYVCPKCGMQTSYRDNVRQMAKVLSRRREEAASLRALGLDITLDESSLCRKCKSAKELGLPTFGTIIKRPEKESDTGKFSWNVGDKVRIVDVYGSVDCGVYVVWPVSSDAWVDATHIDESGGTIEDFVRVHLSPSPDSKVVGMVDKKSSQLKRLPVRPGDPAGWVRVEWPYEIDGAVRISDYRVQSRFVGDLSYDEGDVVAPCRINKLSWVINGTRTETGDDDARILRAFLSGKEFWTEGAGVMVPVKHSIERLYELLYPGYAKPPTTQFDPSSDVQVDI